MKVLWITNILFPEAISLLTNKTDLKSSGGWMLGLANSLQKETCIELLVATVSPLVKSLTVLKGEKTIYYVIPLGKGNLKYNKEYETIWKEVYEKVKPEIVHIHGTEFTHGLAYIKACGNKNVVVSLQGLKSGIAPYYCAGISVRDIYKNLTLHDLVKGSILSQKKQFTKTGVFEKELLCNVKYIIGRTSWDKAHSWYINSNAKYFFCNEILRNEFYDGKKWKYDKCVKESIFISQAGYPLKGFHKLLLAMPTILQYYPNTTIRVAGENITCDKGLKGLLHFTGYGKIIKKIIKKNNIEDRVVFLGPLNAEQMKKEYLNCNIFICPSSIENSSNSLGEAQMLGTPSLASYVGGLPDMMQCFENNLYRFEETEMLAYRIVTLFAESSVWDNTLQCELAKKRHNITENVNILKQIYNTIINN